MEPAVYNYLKQQIISKNFTKLQEGLEHAKESSKWFPCSLNEEQDGISRSLMHYAVKFPESIEFLKNNGINIDIRASNGITPLACAVNEPNIDSVKLLLQFGADINLPYMGFTPFVLAVNNPYAEEIALYLLENGANRFELSDSSEELIKIAINSNKPKLASKFIEQQNETFFPNGHEGIFNLAVTKLFDETVPGDICTSRSLFLRYIDFQILHSRNTIFWESAKDIASLENDALKHKISSGKLLRNNTKSEGFSLVTFAAIFNNINAFFNEEINAPLIEWSQEDIGYKDAFEKTPIEWARIGKSQRFIEVLETAGAEGAGVEAGVFWVGDQIEIHQAALTAAGMAAGAADVSDEEESAAGNRATIGGRQASTRSMKTVILDAHDTVAISEANENTSLIGAQFSDDDCCCCSCCVIQ